MLWIWRFLIAILTLRGTHSQGFYLGKSARFIGTATATKTIGEVWPKPQTREYDDHYQTIDTANLQFLTDVECPILEEAFDRFRNTLAREIERANSRKENPRDDPNYTGLLGQLNVALAGECEDIPHLGVDESYTLDIDFTTVNSSTLEGNSVWGILHGLETFSQLIVPNAGSVIVNRTRIGDYPRFAHRGLMLDTSRHFYKIEIILQILDAMSYNKFNVFHWHLVDDHSFPLQTAVYPDLSQFGAFDSNHIYTPEDVQSVLSFAHKRGIRVMPEIDTPGHVDCWRHGVDGILSECFTESGGELIPDGYGPLDPTLPKTYTVVDSLLTELAQVFPEQYVHLGGDEVPFDCWQSNPNITDFMAAQNISDYASLEQYYINRLLEIASNLPGDKRVVIWQDVFDNGLELSDDTIIHVWKGSEMTEMEKVTAAGNKAILSSCWYLNHVGGETDWSILYACDPQAFNGTDQQKALVLGGEVCMWSEYSDATNVVAKLFPRASSVAERLWSAADVRSTATALPRLEEHRCRMIKRGIPAEPQLGPGFCSVEY